MIIPDLNELVSLHDGVEIFVKPFILKLENKNPNHDNMIRAGRFEDLN